MDLFRSSMSPDAGPAVAKLYTPDANGRVYCGQGPKVDEFEHAFGTLIGLERPPLGVNSCSAAIDLALHLIGVGPGDEVISTPITCSATNGSIVTRGAKIVWADIDSLTGLIDPLSVESAITSRTKAIIAVDWAGRFCDYGALQAVAAGVPIIEDAAHCVYIPVIHGDYVAWSFGPIKHLTTGGYGGALLPPDREYERAKLLRWHGLDRSGPSDSFRCEQDIREAGYRYHLTDDQAVVGLANLILAVDGVESARANAYEYTRRLQSITGLTIPAFDGQCNYWLFGLIVEQQRDLFMQAMASLGIPTSRVHARNDKHTAYRAATARWRPLPGVDYFDAHQVNIPVGWWITNTEFEQIIGAVTNAAQLVTGAAVLAAGHP